MKDRIVSSLPGRVRINVKGLLRNDEKAFGIWSELAGYGSISSFNVNKNTGNVLIYYDDAKIDENKIAIIVRRGFNKKRLIESTAFKNEYNPSLLKIFIDAVNPLSLFRKRYSKRLYKGEYGISFKILKASIVISAAVFLFTGDAANVISIFILGYPGILFALAGLSCYYISAKLSRYEIYVKDNTSLNQLCSINALLIEEEVFKSELKNYNTYDLNLDKYAVQKLVMLGKLRNLVSKDMELAVNKMRILGINNIFIIGDSRNSIVNYIAYLLELGILDKNNSYEDEVRMIAGKSESGSTILIAADKLFEGNLKYPHVDSVIYLYRNGEMDTVKAGFNLQYSDVDKIPSMIKLAYFHREVSIQTENTAVALNIFGMLLVTLNCLTPLYSGIYYILNTLFLTLTLKFRYNSYLFR